jgi:Uri superfamily endonuclease
MKAPKITDSLSGTYLLEIFAPHDFEIEAKRFAGKVFHAGFYYYSGSAQKNYNSRLTRHLKKVKTVHWHIDHLTTNPNNKIINIFLFPDAPQKMECEVVQTLINKFNLDDSITGFGNSDCKTCGTHLLYSPKQLNHNHFIRLYQSTVSLIPSSNEI